MVPLTYTGVILYTAAQYNYPSPQHCTFSLQYLDEAQFSAKIHWHKGRRRYLQGQQCQCCHWLPSLPYSELSLGSWILLPV